MDYKLVHCTTWVSRGFSLPSFVCRYFCNLSFTRGWVLCEQRICQL